MSATMMDELLQLPRDERIDLVNRLSDSLENEVPEMDPELEALLDERMAEYNRNPNAFVTWEELEAELLAIEE